MRGDIFIAQANFTLIIQIFEEHMEHCPIGCLPQGCHREVSVLLFRALKEHNSLKRY